MVDLVLGRKWCPCGEDNNESAHHCWNCGTVREVSPTPAPSPWIPFSERMPEPVYDPANPGKPTHGYILVTNNLSAVDRWDKKSHVWLVDSIYKHHAQMSSTDGYVFAEAGEITAFNSSVQRIRNLTHWRPAFPEEWPEFRGPVDRK